MAVTAARAAFVSNEYRDVVVTNSANETLYGDQGVDGGRGQQGYVESFWDEQEAALAIATERTDFLFAHKGIYRVALMDYIDVDFTSGTPAYTIQGPDIGLGGGPFPFIVSSAKALNAGAQTELIGYVKF